jgi:hypothetical protein
LCIYLCKLSKITLYCVRVDDSDSMVFAYPCPGCQSELKYHEPTCSFENAPRADVESAYIDIIGQLAIAPRTVGTLRSNGNWSPLHTACLETLKRQRRIYQKENGKFKVLTQPERRNHIHPVTEPIQTVYEHGTVQGCHDNGIFALVAYYASQNLSWSETKEVLLEWFDETNTWNRGGFDHATPEDVLADKHHVWDAEYGYWSKARAAKGVIDNYRSRSQSASSDTDTTASAAG